jgi:hypothetical protein
MRICDNQVNSNQSNPKPLFFLVFPNLQPRPEGVAKKFLHIISSAADVIKLRAVASLSVTAAKRCR